MVSTEYLYLLSHQSRIAAYKRDKECFSSCEIRRSGQQQAYTQLVIDRTRIRIGLMFVIQSYPHSHISEFLDQMEIFCWSVPISSINNVFSQCKCIWLFLSHQWNTKINFFFKNRFNQIYMFMHLGQIWQLQQVQT